MKDVSIIIPFYNEEESVIPVLEEAHAACPAAEIIAVDDGSEDSTWKGICLCGFARGLRLTDNRGQSAAMYAGMREASGDVIALMDGDGQNDPHDFPAMVEKLEQSGADVVCGYRAERKDTWSRRTASKVANRIRRAILDDGVRDTGCSVKVFRKEHVELLLPFNGLHRYLPAIFKHAGLTIEQVPVNHRMRSLGMSKYTNWERALRGIYDLFGVRWLLKRKTVYPKMERSDA
jgi:dolichol-phosphate mannosyltransferase